MSDIDDLMNTDPLNLTTANIDAIIAYHRKNRAAGIKPKKESGPKLAEGKSLLDVLGLTKTKAVPSAKPSGTFRRI